MESSSLQQAILLLKSGKKSEAQRLLQRVIQSNPYDEAAWLWYVDTLPTNVERVQALTWCLKFNPNSIAAKKGLALFGASESKPRPDLTTSEQQAQSVPQYREHTTPVVLPAPSTKECDVDKELLSLFGFAPLKYYEFLCEDCGYPLTVCSRCGGYFCEDCQDAHCNFCGEPIYIESEEGFHVVQFVPVWFGPGEDDVEYEEKRVD